MPVDERGGGGRHDSHTTAADAQLIPEITARRSRSPWKPEYQALGVLFWS